MCLGGPPPTGLHFGPEKDYIPGSMFKEARYKIVFCVLYYILEITIQSKCLKYKVASKFADFGKTVFKFKIAPLVDE